MTAQGAHDTERDLYGHPGVYRTLRSRHAVGEPCPRCGGSIGNAAYLGGAVYWCGGCQFGCVSRGSTGVPGYAG